MKGYGIKHGSETCDLRETPRHIPYVAFCCREYSCQRRRFSNLIELHCGCPVPSPLDGQGSQGCPDPQHESYPAAWQYVAGGNGEVKDVLTPSFLTLDPYPEEEQNTVF